jgi:HSP20 family protein
MTLVRTNPFATAPSRRWGDDLFAGFERLIDEVGRADLSGLAADFYETEDAVVLELAVPGVTAAGIDVAVEGRTLTIRAELPNASGENRRYWLRTLPRGASTRTVKLPVGIDPEAIEARVANGLLHLRMPKAPEAKVRKLAIQEG